MNYPKVIRNLKQANNQNQRVSNDAGKIKQDLTPNANKEKKPKKSIADDIERLKNRREERKKIDDAKKEKKELIQQNLQEGKTCDIDFEKLINKKKASVNQTPENVNLNLNSSTPPRKMLKYLFV